MRALCLGLGLGGALLAVHCGPASSSSAPNEAPQDAGIASDSGVVVVDRCARPARPDAPSALLALSTSAYEVVLAWSPPADASVTHYRILEGTTELALIDAVSAGGAPIAKPRFVHRPVAPGASYRYTVSALNAAGGESLPTEVLAVMVPAAVPDAIDRLEAGHWLEIPNSTLAASALKEADFPWLGWGERISGIMNDWSSGALDTQRDQLFVHGGGHNGYFGNEVYAFDLHTFRWTPLTVPDAPAGDHAECPEKSLGVPCATHTYDGLEYLPPPFDRFLVVGWDGWPQTTLDLNTHRWTAYPEAPQRGGRTGANSAYDPNTNKLWFHAGDGALSYWDPATGHWTLRGGGDGLNYGRNAVVDPVHTKYVAVGGGETRTWSSDGISDHVPLNARVATTGDREIEDAAMPGAEFDPVRQEIVAWNGGGNVYTLAESGAWTRHAPVGSVVAPPRNVNGTFGRFRYVPRRNVYVAVNRVDENVFVYRLSGTAPSLPQTLEVRAKETRIEEDLSTSITVDVLRAGSTTKASVTKTTTFRSLDPSVATVDKEGTVHGLTAGFARIQASYTDPNTRVGVLGSVVVEVVAPSAQTLEGLAISPSSKLAVVRGASISPVAIATYQRGTTRIVRDVSCEANWQSDQPMIASLQQTQRVFGSDIGATQIHATLAGMRADADISVVKMAGELLLRLNFQPTGAPLVSGWMAADDSPFDPVRGWGWVTLTNPTTRADRSGTSDPRNASFVLGTGRFRVQVPDGLYWIAATLGDNDWGSGLYTAKVAGVSVVDHVGTGTTGGTALVAAKGGQGILLDVAGAITWLAVMPANGSDLEQTLDAVKTW